MAQTPTDPPAETPVTITREGAVAVVTLDAPQSRNALTATMREALIGALDGLMTEAGCRAIVLTGAGGVFCAGGDLKSMVGATLQGARHRMMRGHRLVRLIAEGPKPVLTAVEGAAFGAGMSIAAMSDLCIVSREARFGAVFGKVGLAPDWGWMWSVPMRIGMGRARRMAMLSEVIDADEALRIGLADMPAEPGQALSVALEQAQLYAGAATLAIGATKSAFCRHMASLDAVLAFEIDQQPGLMLSEDHVGARDAFFAKQAPVFNGA